MKDLRVGISGWTYPPWRGVFFPEKWPQKRELEYASRQVNSIEINGTFYSLQRPASFRAWYEATPDEFVFSVKAPRFITHIKRLKNVEAPLANFFASGVLCLREKLGPILWQLPPSFRFDPERVRAFFKLLPRDTTEAAKLARQHDGKLKDSAVPREKTRPLQHAMEVRHESFQCAEFIALLRKYRVALVVADTAGRWPFMEDVTSDFVYVRLHGDEELYTSGYTDKALREWTRKVSAWSKGKTPARVKTVARSSAPVRKRGREVYVYFDNDVKVRAPFDAMALAYRLHLGPEPPKMGKLAKPKETARRVWPPVKRRWKAEPKT